MTDKPLLSDIDLGFVTGSLGFVTGSLGFVTGSLGFVTGSLGFVMDLHQLVRPLILIFILISQL